jgi:DNA-binding transcriptional ArsR family regulator
LPWFRDVPELVLAPSYWSTPLVFLGKVNPERSILLFGARPANASLIPGEVVPDALLRVLKAMADPTRLRILRYLVCEQLTPAEISRRLRLRAPTVTHHLSELRLAGLVHITFEEHAERRYTARMEGVLGLNELLDEFLQCRGKG